MTIRRFGGGGGGGDRRLRLRENIVDRLGQKSQRQMKFAWLVKRLRHWGINTIIYRFDQYPPHLGVCRPGSKLT